MPLLGAVLMVLAVVIFNVLMAKRGCEKVYFTKYCIPKGQDVKPYYTTSFLAELLLSICLYAIFLLIELKMTSEFVPISAIGVKSLIIPVAITCAEIGCLWVNRSRISKMTRTAELEAKRKKEEAKKTMN